MPLNKKLLAQIQANEFLLHKLDLSKQRLTTDGLQQLTQALITNTMLTSLNLNYNQIGDEGAKALATNTILTSLNLERNGISDEGAQALAANKMLTSLELGYNQIDAKGVQALAANPTLTSLNLAGNKMGDEGAKALAANTTLASLELGHNQIGAEGAQALAANTTLISLGLTWNQMGAEGAQALAANTTLTSLNLGVNQIGAEGAKALAANTTLTSLDLSYNPIGTEGAKAFRTNITLTFLTLYKNNIAQEIEDNLKAVILHNQQQQVLRRNQFLRTLVILTLDPTNPMSASYWAQLPREIQSTILKFLPSTYKPAIGKTTQQIVDCIEFVVNHRQELKDSLVEAHRTSQCLKLIESTVNGHRQFRFFPVPLQVLEIKEAPATKKPKFR